jgi:hypothetical protein
MKCIHCGTHSRLQDRRAGRCSKCKHRFAFEPIRDKHHVTDGQLQAAIDRVSGESRVMFTERELWYELNRRKIWPGFRRTSYGCLPWLGLMLAALVVMAGMGIPLSFSAIALVVAVGVKLGALGFAVRSHRDERREPSRPRDISFDEFRAKYLAKWRKVHGEIPLLVPRREAARLEAPRQVPADVAAFSFDRAVVTEHWDTAAMLVANRFHFEHNCAVLSGDGYPGGIAPTVKEMLRRNPRLTVFALHDASPGGCLLPATLREPEWFPEPSVRIVDVGLRPGTVRALKLPAVHEKPGKLPPRLADLLPAEDVKWLRQGNVGELAALRPTQVMRTLARAIAAAAAANASADGGYDGGGGGGGIIWFGDLGGSGSGGGDTSTTDGFG